MTVNDRRDFMGHRAGTYRPWRIIMKILLRALAMLVVLVPFGAFADDKDHPELDKKTLEVMKKLGPFYKDAKSMRTEAAVETVITPEEGEKRTVKAKVTIEFKRPNLFSLRAKMANNDKAGPEVICDGKSLYIHARALKQYRESKAPTGLDVIGREMLRLDPGITGILFIDALQDDPAEALLDNVTKGEHLGMDKIDGKEAHHLKFKQEGLDWEMWVASGDEPWVMKVSSVREAPNGKIATVETYSKWKLNDEPTKDIFTFKAPDDAKKVKTIGRQKDDDGDPR
jgi:hypothetical protein